MAVSKKLLALDPRFGDCEFLVEANSYEQLALWKEWHVAVPWKEDRSGLFLKVGSVGVRPIMLCVFFAHINGHRVGFYEATSQVVDLKKIDAFLKKHFAVTYDGDTRWAHCDAMNFGHCISCVVDIVRDYEVFETMVNTFEEKMEQRYKK